MIITVFRETHMATIKVAPVKPTIPFEVLEKIDIRVGTIKLIEDVKGSNKLLKMTVDSAITPGPFWWE